MSKYLAYSFLYDDASDLRCDFELLTDEISSMIGLLRSLLNEKDRAADPDLAEDLDRINELMYHLNPSLRKGSAVTGEELEWLHGKTMALQEAVKDGLPRGRDFTFVIPRGCIQAAWGHVIRCKCKMLVRLLSRYRQQGHPADDILFDFANLYAGYFYFLALRLNKNQGLEEQPFTSRVY
ncbi:MAG: ATP--cob(I)alamin adenosyltransferase [Treponema sp.]|jgi:cob(I)alamin adenosyltransferase|nr:ATP--cob(I)alamin adenosyltransferase [Treponema sp.]